MSSIDKIYSLDYLLNDKSNPPPQLIGGGILLNRSLLLIAGAKKVRKTFLAYNFGVALATGKSFAGFEIKQQSNVFIFSAEGGYFPNRERIQTMCKDVEQEARQRLNICFDSRLKLENYTDIDKIVATIKEYQPEVLVIDPFVKFHGLEENSAKEMGHILDQLRILIEDYKLSIILVHHLGKDQTHGARGSSAILGEYDSCITLTKEGSENKHQNKIEFDLRHSISPDSRKLLFNSKTFWFEEEESEIVKILRTYGTQDKKTLVDRCISSELYAHQSGAYKAIDREVANGKIGLSEEGKYYVKIKTT